MKGARRHDHLYTEGVKRQAVGELGKKDGVGRHQGANDEEDDKV